MNILIVDDEEVQIESLRRALRSKGYQVFEALSAVDALEQLDKMTYRIDAVLTDYIRMNSHPSESFPQVKKAGIFLANGYQR
jgi:CheY-like chemotaxis protein